MLVPSVPEYAALTTRPSSRSATVDGFRFDVMYEPAEDVGGDFYVAASRGPRGVRVVIGDACGKGAAASAIVEGLRADLERLTTSSDSPDAGLARLNELLVDRLRPDAFVTALCLDLHVDETVTVANAGHLPLLVRAMDGSIRAVGAASGPPLGVLAGARYTSDTLGLAPEDVLILMTDGVSDAFGPATADMRGVRSALAAIRRGRAGNIVRAASLRAGPFRVRKLSDDATLLTVGRSIGG